MKTTLDLKEEALKLGEKVSSEQGRPLGDVVSEAILTTYGEIRLQSAQTVEFDPPRSGRLGLLPGVDLDKTSEVLDLMDGL